jgi:hypothetical protein
VPVPLPEVATSLSRPDLVPPSPVIDRAATGDVAPGLLFATPLASEITDAGVLVYGDDGQVVYFRPATGTAVGNAAVHELNGEPVLAWFEGFPLAGPASYRGEYVLVDANYHEVTRLRMSNGYDADIHDLYITPEGTALLLAYYPMLCDEAVMSGCTPGGTVFDGVIQEVDIATGIVLFEWHAADHLSMTDSFADPATDPFDFLHPNSLDIDDDGNILMSARLTSSLYKIDRVTGEVLFVFGGKQNQFTYVDEGSDTIQGPDYPHDFRPLGGGRYTYFDNGVQRQTESRGAIVALDVGSMTATYEESITHDPPLFETSQGRMQTLANGNELIAWGGSGVATEYAIDRTVAFEASLGVGTYRQVRDAWIGAPTDPPDAVVVDDGSDGAVVAVSWNGDTRAAAWQLLAGDTPDALSLLSTVPRTGFETRVPVTGRHAFVAVQALDSDGVAIEGGQTAAMSSTASPALATPGAPTSSG